MLKRIAASALVAVAGFALSAPNAGAAECPVGHIIHFSGSGTPSSRFHVAVARYIVEKGWGCKAGESDGRGAGGLIALARGDLHIAMQASDGETWDGMKAAGKVVEPGRFGATADPAITVVVGMNAKFAAAAGPITAMLSKYRPDAATVKKALAYMKMKSDETGAEAAVDFLGNNEAIWTKWVPADVAAKVKAALAEEASAEEDDDSIIQNILRLADRLDPRLSKGEKWSEKEALAKLSGNLCNAFLENDFPSLQEALKNGSKRLLGREVPLEKAYLYTRCRQPVANNCDLLRVVAEDPLVSKLAAKKMVLYFTRQTPNRALLGKILRCRRDFGFGCVDVLEHLEENANVALRAGRKHKAQILIDFKALLLKLVDKKYLKRDRAFCRQFLDEPRTCQ